MTTITITNQKGGVGKTTTIALASALTHSGKRVLVINTNPQGNLTAVLDVNSDDVPGLLELMTDKSIVQDVKLHTFAGDLSLRLSIVSGCRACMFFETAF